MVIGDDAKQLNNHVKHVSQTLAKIGIVHVREDINLEKTFLLKNKCFCCLVHFLKYLKH